MGRGRGEDEKVKKDEEEANKQKQVGKKREKVGLEFHVVNYSIHFLHVTSHKQFGLDVPCMQAEGFEKECKFAYTMRICHQISTQMSFVCALCVCTLCVHFVCAYLQCGVHVSAAQNTRVILPEELYSE